MEVLHRVATDLFCLAVLVFLRSWNLPDDRFSRMVISRFSRFFVGLGISHTWSMFAPKPISHNDVLLFKLIYSDGSHTVFIPPYFPTLDGAAIRSNVRHLKFMHSLSVEGNAAFKDSYARYILDNHLPIDAPRPEQIEFLLVRQPEAQWEGHPGVTSGELFEKTVYTYRTHA